MALYTVLSQIDFCCNLRTFLGKIVLAKNLSFSTSVFNMLVSKKESIPVKPAGRKAARLSTMQPAEIYNWAGKSALHRMYCSAVCSLRLVNWHCILVY